MTPEDDAFIRTIVDSPGDDLPRLVYADWLDERGDPRGAYLRAELEWAKPWRDGNRPGDASEVRALGAGLDAVWVARVSRPPVGVCCDHIKFKQHRPQPTHDAVRAVEHRFNLKLPIDCQAFLLNTNAIWSDSVLFNTGSDYHDPLIYIFAIISPDGTPYGGPGKRFATTFQYQQLDLPWRILQIEQGHSWPEWDDPVVQDFIPIICTAEEPDGESGWLSIGIRGAHYGAIVKFSFDGATHDCTIIQVTSTFAEFCGDLKPVRAVYPKFSIRRRLFES